MNGKEEQKKERERNVLHTIKNTNVDEEETKNMATTKKRHSLYTVIQEKKKCDIYIILLCIECHLFIIFQGIRLFTIENRSTVSKVYLIGFESK